MQRRTGSGYVKKIDFVFYNEKRIRCAVAEAREDRGSHGRNGSSIADPTAALAIRNATPLRQILLDGVPLEWPEDWIRVIDAVYAWCDRDRLIVAKDRYAGIDYRVTCAKLNISAKTYYNFLDETRNHAAICAAQLGLVKVC